MSTFEQLKAQIFAKQIILAKIYARAGTQSLSDYVRSWAISNPSDITRAFFNQAHKLLLRVYPEKLVGEVIKQAGHSPLCSTIDHHGILTHPFFINSNLIYSQRERLEYLLCFSTASVSLNNSSWPGCLLVSRQDGQMERFSFFRDKIKTQAVLATKGFEPSDVKRVRSHIGTADFLSKDEKGRLLGLTQEIFQDPKLFEFSDFSGQAAYASTALWQKIFPSAPKLLYLPLEELVCQLIINEIAPRKDHILYKLFFTPSGWDSIEKYFQGSLGAFTQSHFSQSNEGSQLNNKFGINESDGRYSGKSGAGFSGGHKGSFLFWGIMASHHRAHLYRKGSRIFAEGGLKSGRNDEGLVGIDLSAGSIVHALSNNILYPTSLVCFLVLLYYGITCLGGFNQVNWLTGIKGKFIDLLKELGDDNLANRVAAVPTENFAEGSLAFSLNQRGQIYKPTVLDLFLQDNPGIFEKYRQMAFQITLGESIEAQFPEIYKIVFPAKNRDSKLLNITENDILKYNGMADKIKSVF